MPWNPPDTWSVGEVVTAAKMTMNVKENSEWLKTVIDIIHGAAKFHRPGNFQQAGSGAVSDAPDGGPEVTVTIGDSGLAIVGHGTDHQGVTGALGRGSITYRTYGASVTESNVMRSMLAPTYSSLPYQLRTVNLEDSLNPGATTFRQQYATTAGGKVNFWNRFIFVIPLG